MMWMNKKMMCGLVIGVLVAIGGVGVGEGKKKLIQKNNPKDLFKSALAKQTVSEIFNALGELKNVNLDKKHSDDILTGVNKLINQKNIDQTIASIKEKSISDILETDLYKFYQDILSLTISRKGFGIKATKMMNPVVLADETVAGAIKEAQNKVADFLLEKILFEIDYYSGWNTTSDSIFPNYSSKMIKAQIMVLGSDDVLAKQLEYICFPGKEGASYKNIEIKTETALKSIFFRAEDIDKELVVDKKSKTVKTGLEDALKIIAKVYKNVWLFDHYVRDAKAIIDENTFELTEFSVCKTDCKDITALLGNSIQFDKDKYSGCIVQKNVLETIDTLAVGENQELYGFHDYVVNVFTAAKLLAWAGKVNEKIDDKSDFLNAIKTLEGALTACTGPTVKLDELKSAIAVFAVAKDKMQLYEVKSLDDLSGGEFKTAYENDKLKKEEEEKKKNLTPSKQEDLPKGLSLLKAKLLSLATQLKK